MDDTLLKAAHDSLAIRWGTSTPYALGVPILLRQGFADVKSVTIPIDVPAGATAGIIPICRQRAYSYLGEHGLGPDAVQFRPMVGSRTLYYGGREEGIFLNENESATDKVGRPVRVGARKRGARLWVHFEHTEATLGRHVTRAEQVAEDIVAGARRDGLVVE